MEFRYGFKKPIMRNKGLLRALGKTEPSCAACCCSSCSTSAKQLGVSTFHLVLPPAHDKLRTKKIKKEDRWDTIILTNWPYLAQEITAAVAIFKKERHLQYTSKAHLPMPWKDRATTPISSSARA